MQATHCMQLSGERRKVNLNQKKGIVLFNHASDYAVLNQLVLPLVDILYVGAYKIISYTLATLLPLSAEKIITKPTSHLTHSDQ